MRHWLKGEIESKIKNKKTLIFEELHGNNSVGFRLYYNRDGEKQILKVAGNLVTVLFDEKPYQLDGDDFQWLQTICKDSAREVRLLDV